MTSTFFSIYHNTNCQVLYLSFGICSEVVIKYVCYSDNNIYIQYLLITARLKCIGSGSISGRPRNTGISSKRLQGRFQYFSDARMWTQYTPQKLAIVSAVSSLYLIILPASRKLTISNFWGVHWVQVHIRASEKYWNLP